MAEDFEHKSQEGGNRSASKRKAEGGLLESLLSSDGQASKLPEVVMPVDYYEKPLIPPKRKQSKRPQKPVFAEESKHDDESAVDPELVKIEARMEKLIDMQQQLNAAIEALEKERERCSQV